MPKSAHFRRFPGVSGYAVPKLALLLCLCFLALSTNVSLSQGSGAGAPEVRALLFYDPATSRSQDLFAFYLPALFERYGTRLDVSGIDLSRPEGKEAYAAVAGRLGLPSQPPGQPVVVVANQAIVGLLDIATVLGDHFEELAKDPDARRWPSDPALAGLLTGGVADIQARVAGAAVPPAGKDAAKTSSGELPLGDKLANGLAIVVLLGMLATLAHSLVRLWRQDGLLPGRAAIRALLLVLLAGLAIAGYTAYAALGDVELVCGPIGGCARVQGSEYAHLFGLPMGVIGLVGYGLIFVTWLIARYLSPRGGGWYWLPWALALFGVLFSLRLTALEVFVIGETCLWCLGSAVSITATLWLLSGFMRGRDTAG
jgi:uncharacterized membrane protein